MKNQIWSAQTACAVFVSALVLATIALEGCAATKGAKPLAITTGPRAASLNMCGAKIATTGKGGTIVNDKLGGTICADPEVIDPKTKLPATIQPERKYGISQDPKTKQLTVDMLAAVHLPDDLKAEDRAKVLSILKDQCAADLQSIAVEQGKSISIHLQIVDSTDKTLSDAQRGAAEAFDLLYSKNASGQNAGDSAATAASVGGSLVFKFWPSKSPLVYDTTKLTNDQCAAKSSDPNSTAASQALCASQTNSQASRAINAPFCRNLDKVVGHWLGLQDPTCQPPLAVDPSAAPQVNSDGTLTAPQVANAQKIALSTIPDSSLIKGSAAIPVNGSTNVTPIQLSRIEMAAVMNCGSKTASTATVNSTTALTDSSDPSTAQPQTPVAANPQSEIDRQLAIYNGIPITGTMTQEEWNKFQISESLATSQASTVSAEAQKNAPPAAAQTEAAKLTTDTSVDSTSPTAAVAGGPASVEVIQKPQTDAASAPEFPALDAPAQMLTAPDAAPAGN
jgi:hypothetical protein